MSGGDILSSGLEALVNPVNCFGVSGAGLALAFREAFPENYAAYRFACELGAVMVGKMFLHRSHKVPGPKWIVNFPTKEHWQDRSKIEWIEEGLTDLIRVVRKNEIRSLGVPALGAGLGGLPWPQVRALLGHRLGPIVRLRTVVFDPR